MAARGGHNTRTMRSSCDTLNRILSLRLGDAALSRDRFGRLCDSLRRNVFTTVRHFERSGASSRRYGLV